MRQTAARYAAIAAAATAAVGVVALMGVERLPVAEYLLFPGSMLAWLYKGDNYASSREFIAHAVAFGVPLNAMFGCIIGVMLAAIRVKFGRKVTPDS